MLQRFSGLLVCLKIARKMREFKQKPLKFGEQQKEKSLENVVFSRLFGGGGKGIRTLVGVSPNGFQGTITHRKMTDFARR
jgi:hypothetical protein